MVYGERKTSRWASSWTNLSTWQILLAMVLEAFSVDVCCTFVMSTSQVIG